MRKAAVICAEGLGDSLNMMIASHTLARQGYDVTTFSKQLGSFGSWLPSSGSFKTKPSLDTYKEIFSDFHLIILQHENSDKAKTIRSLFAQTKKPKLITFYNNYRISKHEPVRDGVDFAFDEGISMADNVSMAMQRIFHLSYSSKAIGLTPPSGLIHRRYRKRVIIHPTSAREIKNWSKRQFHMLCKKLTAKGFEPWVILPQKERKEWLTMQSYGAHLPLISSFEESASIFYESGYFIGNDSGPGHLASYLRIPLLTIAPFRSISHWQPGWFPSLLMKPYPICPNLKGMRLKEKHWQWFLPLRKVLHGFKSLVKSHP